MRPVVKKLGIAAGLVALGLFVGVAGLRVAQIAYPATPQPIGQPRGFTGHITGGDFFGTRASSGGGSGDLTEVTGTSPIAVTSGTGPIPDVALSTTGCVDGETWQRVGGAWACEPVGDLTAVSVAAGSGLTGGGASGAVSLALLYPNAGMILYDDALSCSTTGNMGGIPIAVSGSGAGCIASTTTATANRPSVLGLSAGTAATGRSAWASTGTLFFDSTVNSIFETHVSPQALSDGTNTWTWRGGWCDVITGADCVDGVYFEYDQSASANWRCKTAANSVRTATNSTVAVTVNTYHRLKITLTEDSSALFEVDGVTVCGGAISTNIPSGSTRNTFFTPGITNSTAGSSNTRAMDTDYWWFVSIFDANR